MKIILNILRALFYGLKVLLRPSDIHSLLKVGDILSHSKALTFAAEKAKQDPEAGLLIEERYCQGFPSAEVLAQMPVGSLGHSLAQHLQQHGLQNYPERSLVYRTDAVYLRERQRQIHDLLHVVLGCGISVREEACVNAFVMAQTGAPISILIVFGVLLRALMKNPAGVLEDMEAIFKAWSCGRQARSPFGFRWEARLEAPLAEVREYFNLSSEGLNLATAA
jgi:ubiquinone biosynthesis protein COQ4